MLFGLIHTTVINWRVHQSGVTFGLLIYLRPQLVVGDSSTLPILRVLSSLSWASFLDQEASRRGRLRLKSLNPVS